MSDRNERLSALLRKGDPAAGDSGLSPEELRTLRRAMLSAVPEPNHRAWLVPVLAAAAVLALATALALSLWRTERGPEPPVIAHPVQPIPLPTPVLRQPEPEAPPALEPSARKERVKKPKKPRAPQPAPEPVAPVAVVAQHQVQFSTPGGTRVIWVLKPAAE